MRARTDEADERDARVAVVMITYNRRATATRTLERLARLPERPRTVVVDNGSTDGTAQALAVRFPDVRVIEAGANLGAAGRTLGVRLVDEPYVAFCDDDTWWGPGALRRAADWFDARPRLAVVTGRVLVGAEEREDPACALLARSPLPREDGMPGPPLLGFLAGASMVRRSAFLEAGGFEPRFFIGGEEELLAADLAARGWWLCYVPELVVRHCPSPLRDATARRATIARNALWFAWMRRPWPVALRETARFLAQARLGRAERRALLECLKGIPWALRHRRPLPRSVESGIRLLEGRS